MRKQVWRAHLLRFFLFWMIALGLGYPTLARYDPSKIPGIIDAKSYAAMVGGADAELGQHEFRILIPLLARPVEILVRGKIGSWNPVQFSMLFVCGFFVAWSALLVTSIATRVFSDPTIGLTAAWLFLLSFNVSNFMLAGLVDSAESWAVLATLWILLSRRSLLLPLVGIAAALGKETSVFLMVPFCVTWYAFERRARTPGPLLGPAVIAMISCQVATVLALKTFLHIESLNVLDRGFMPYGFSAPMFDRSLFYTFSWLLPLGLLRIRSLPSVWIASTMAAVICVVTVGLQVGNGIGGNMSRPLFNILGPLLLVSTSAYLCEIATGVRSNPTLFAK
jgi:hypothetical protein